MKHYIEFILMPLIGALIGWLTNMLAIKLIFRPLNPVKIPILNIKMQGLIPKRRTEIARNIGEALEREIISSEDIIKNLTSEGVRSELKKSLKEIIASKITAKVPGFIPSSIANTIAAYIGDMIGNSADQIFDEIKVEMIKKAKRTLRLKELVEKKINSLNLEELEKLIIELSKRELKQIEILGAVIGFIIGLFQFVISDIIKSTL